MGEKSQVQNGWFFFKLLPTIFKGKGMVKGCVCQIVLHENSSCKRTDGDKAGGTTKLETYF